MGKLSFDLRNWLKIRPPAKKNLHGEAPEHIIGTTDWPPLSVAPGSALGAGSTLARLKTWRTTRRLFTFDSAPVITQQRHFVRQKGPIQTNGVFTP